jgi:hypothetical protein
MVVAAIVVLGGVTALLVELLKPASADSDPVKSPVMWIGGDHYIKFTPNGNAPDNTGYTLGNFEHISETCQLLVSTSGGVKKSENDTYVVRNNDGKGDTVSWQVSDTTYTFNGSQLQEGDSPVEMEGDSPVEMEGDPPVEMEVTSTDPCTTSE